MFGDNRKKFDKRIVVLLVFFILFSSFSPLLATRAKAQLFVPVWDPGNFSLNAVTSANTTSLSLKELGFDGVAYMILNLVIERIAASTVNWINSGFRGSPAFVTDPEAYFQDLGDKIAGQYIFSNPNLNFLCGPINAKIRLALTNNYIQDRVWQCTLTDAVGNVDDFMGDFERGGWDKFFELSQRQQNSPIGAYLQAENEMYLQISSRQGSRRQELLQGNGFLSFRKCKATGNVAASVNPTKRVCVENAPLEVGNPDSGQCLKWEDQVDDVAGQIAEDVCVGGEEIVTPGSVIQTQLNKTLGIGSDKLAVADEINEIMSAILNQLIGQIVGGIGRGLRGLSSPDSSGQTFTSQLSNSDKDAQITNYFDVSNSSVDNVLNSPPYDPYVCRNNPNLPECLPPSGSPSGSCAPTDMLCQTCKNNPTLPQCQFLSTP